MASTKSYESCLVLRALHFIGTVALAGCASAHAPSHGSDCGQGTLVEADASAFCVYRSDLPLVIEGGFECPASYAFRLELARGIACGNRELGADELPLDVCREIGEDCTVVELPDPEVFDRLGGPGECISPCESDEDCHFGPILSSVHDADNVACLEGACRYTGCNDDDECAADIPEPATVCRADARDEVPVCRDACEVLADCPGADGSLRDSHFDCVDGACLWVGCTSDEQCPAPSQCADSGRGYRDCYFKCETPQDCADAAQEGAGLDAPDPLDPYTYASGFICRDGLCEIKPTGCASDDDCDGESICKR